MFGRVYLRVDEFFKNALGFLGLEGLSLKRESENRGMGTANGERGTGNGESLKRGNL